MPPVIGAAVELAASLTWAGLEAREQRIYKQGKTNKYLWAKNVAAGMAGFPDSC